jgi:class 3 adenylate cyclase/pimeloyl-ACP methyl ester carboxylesterase
MEQQIGFCTASDGVRIGYATYGNDAAPPILFEASWMGQENAWGSPDGRTFLEGLATGRRLITYDKRGMGLSTCDIAKVSYEADVEDILSLADALSLERFDVFSMFGHAAVPFAAGHPDRVERLVLWCPQPHVVPYAPNFVAMVRDSWEPFTRYAASLICPTGPGDAQRWCTRILRDSLTPDYVLAQVTSDVDNRETFRGVAAPTLILHRRDVHYVRIENGREVAALIPNARFVPLPGDQQNPIFNSGDYMHIVHEFLGVGSTTPVAPAPQPEAPASTTAVILFLDIAGSTELTERLGDAAFRDRTRRLDAVLRDLVRADGGTPVEGRVLGDGLMAVFQAANGALAAASRCIDAARLAEFELHAGIHAGDVIREEDNVYGGAVNIAARVCRESAPGEILVSDVVRGLARTSSDVTFEDRGLRELRGVADPQRLFAVIPRPTRQGQA